MRNDISAMMESLLDEDFFKQLFSVSNSNKTENRKKMAEKRIIHPVIVDETEVERIRQTIEQSIGKRVQDKTTYLIAAISRILDEHRQYGKLTVRQVYYQLVTKGVIKNSKVSYQIYDHHLTTGRKAGVIPWDAFEDRARFFYAEKKPHYDISNIDSVEGEIQSWFYTILGNSLSNNYDLPMWKNQAYYVEVWVEKDALAGFLSPVCESLGVGLVVSRGYTSYTFKAEANRRFENMLYGEQNRSPVILYLGDLDPSGYDIYRCLNDELKNVSVQRIGLLPGDVNQFGLISNPINTNDRRMEGFKKLFPELGDNVYELDALPPGELTDRTRRNVLSYFDQDIFEQNQRKVRHWRANLTGYQKKIKKLLGQAGISV